MAAKSLSAGSCSYSHVTPITRESLVNHLARAEQGSEAVRQAAELGRANRKEQQEQQAAGREKQRRGGFLARFGLFGG